MKTIAINLKSSPSTKAGIPIILKDKDKSPIEIHDRNTYFSSILDETTAQVTTDEAEIEKTNEDEALKKGNTTSVVISSLIPSPSGITSCLWKDEPIPQSDDMKSTQLIDNKYVSILSDVNDDSTMISDALFLRSALFETAGIDAAFKQEIVSLRPSDKGSISVTLTTDLKHSATETLNLTNILKNANTVCEEITASVQKNPPASRPTHTERIPVSSIPDLKNTVMSTVTLLKTPTSEPAENTDQINITQVKNHISFVDPPTGNQLFNNVELVKHQNKAEQIFENNIKEISQQIKTNFFSEEIFSDDPRPLLSPHTTRLHEIISNERALIPKSAKKLETAVSNKDAKSSNIVTENVTQAELPNKAVFMKNTQLGSAGPDYDNEKSLNLVPIHQNKIADRDMLPFRIEMPHMMGTHETRLSHLTGPAEINTQAVIDQIIEAQQTLNSGFGRVRVTLDPPNLGTINLEIITRKERVEVVITTDTASVQQALQSRVDDIRTALQRQDLKIETFQILLQDNTTNQQQANNGTTFEQQGKRSRQNNPEESSPIQPLIQSTVESGSIRGLVSIFV